MRSPKLAFMGGVLLMGCVPLFPWAAMAATYLLPIQNGSEIQIIFVDGGDINRVGKSDQNYLFEVEMPEGRCSSEVRVVFYNGQRLKVPYDVCSQAGFGVTQIRR